MRFCVITHVEHIEHDDNIYGYAPYINEMNIWFKYVDEVVLVAPKNNELKLNPIFQNYNFKNIEFKRIKAFNIKSIKSLLYSFFAIPYNLVLIYLAFKKSDHIHLRCPGNIGLLGCVVQIFFPSKPKTAKYAGNWDFLSKQPLSYRLQKWILNNRFLSKNMQVLVYGEWPNTSINIKPFFTATYSDSKKELIEPRSLENKIKFIFVGTLTEGKRPFYSLQIVECLRDLGYDVCLDFFGNGEEMQQLVNYVEKKALNDFIFFHGNQSRETIELAYKKSNFLILPSKSEGWPKVVAEAMFWGCLPLTSDVSCVNYLIGNGARGQILNLNLNEDVENIKKILNNFNAYNLMCKLARDWSQQFTTDYFENEIKKIIKN